jgi:hypothetical protein
MYVPANIRFWNGDGKILTQVWRKLNMVASSDSGHRTWKRKEINYPDELDVEN